MSSYNTHPPTSASCILHLPPYGDLDIELFATQCPLTTRNFITLGLEGYFTNTPVLRVIPEFIVQMGAPTIHGGEMIYEDENGFQDEFHSRLRFTGRGMLAMANSGPNTNKSQFFFTLRQTEELNGVNTLFGKITGDTIYNLVRISEIQCKNEVPVSAPIIKGFTMVINPLHIELRTTWDHKIASSEKAQKLEKLERRKKVLSKKNVSLLSFDEDTGDQIVVKNKTSAHDYFEEPNQIPQPGEDALGEPVPIPPRSPKAQESTITHPRVENTDLPRNSPQSIPNGAEPDTQSSSKTLEKIAKVEAEIRKLNKTAEAPKAIVKPLTALQQLQKEWKGKIYNKKDQTNNSTLSELNKFRRNLNKVVREGTQVEEVKVGKECKLHGIPDCASCLVSMTEDAEIVDREASDTSMFRHTLIFGKDLLGKDLMAKRDDVDDLVVIDPRDKASQKMYEQHMSKKRRKT